ncbi:MAG: hypothetical protein ACLFQP_01230 [Halothece sp.]
MRFKWVNQSKIVLLLFLFILTGSGVIFSQDFFAVASQGEDCSPKATEPLYRVDEVEWQSHENQGFLNVKGTARTGGWTGICLYEDSSDSDTQVFQLRGVPPQGMATQALTPVSTKKEINLSELSTDELIVKAETNCQKIHSK